MDRWVGKVAVVTGASAGIGLATAKSLVQQGMIVVGLARRQSKMTDSMKEMNGDGEFHAIECDLTQEQQVREAFDLIKKNLGTVHILINNAATFKFGSVADLDFTELRKIIDTNFVSLLLCSKLAMAMMKEGGHESHVIMMNSIAGQRVLTKTQMGDHTNVYPPIKFAIKALSRILESEVFGENIRITNVSPGAVSTEMISKDAMPPDEGATFDFLEPEDIADAVVYVIGTPSRVQIEELTIKPRRAPY